MPDIADLTSAFSPTRLSGRAASLLPGYAIVPENLIRNLPQQSGYGCKSLGIMPVDREKGIVNEVPPDFNPLPKTAPGSFPYPVKP